MQLEQCSASRFLTLRVLWPVSERPDSGRVGGVQCLDAMGYLVLIGYGRQVVDQRVFGLTNIRKL